MKPKIGPVFRVHIPASEPGRIVRNPLVREFQEWCLDNEICTVPGTSAGGPDFYVADFEMVHAAAIRGWFSRHLD